LFIYMMKPFDPTPKKPIYKSISDREIDSSSDSNTLDDMCSLGIQLRCVTIVGFLLAVFKTIALVVL